MQSVVIILAMALTSVAGNFDRECPNYAYRHATRRRSILLCTKSLTLFVQARCKGDNFNFEYMMTSRHSGSERNSDVFIDSSQALSLLAPQRSFATGLVCECCLHRCSVHELDQYCDPSKKEIRPLRRRRSLNKRRAASRTPPAEKSHFTEKDVEEFYENLEKVSPEVVNTQLYPSNVIDQVHTLEQHKLENIKNSQDESIDEIRSIMARLKLLRPLLSSFSENDRPIRHGHHGSRGVYR